MKKSRLLTLFSICSAVFLGALWDPGSGLAREGNTLIVGTLDRYAPYSSSKIKGGGLCPAITSYALEKAGYKVEVRFMEWEKVLEGAQDGSVDIITCSWYLKNREHYIVYTRLIHAARLVFAVRSIDPFEYKSLDDLAGKKVGVVSGYGYPQKFLDDTRFERIDGLSVAHNLRDVAAGKLDATLDDEGLMRVQLNTELFDIANDLRFTRGALLETPLISAVSRKRPDAVEIVRRFNAALGIMAGDGTLKSLRREYGLQ